MQSGSGTTTAQRWLLRVGIAEDKAKEQSSRMWRPIAEPCVMMEGHKQAIEEFEVILRMKYAYRKNGYLRFRT